MDQLTYDGILILIDGLEVGGGRREEEELGRSRLEVGGGNLDASSRLEVGEGNLDASPRLEVGGNFDEDERGEEDGCGSGGNKEDDEPRLIENSATVIFGAAGLEEDCETVGLEIGVAADGEDEELDDEPAT